MKKLFFLVPLLCLSFLIADTDFITDWNNSEELKPATFGYLVMDLDSNQVLLNHNEQKVLPAASTQKLISTSIALHQLGSDHTFSTTIAHNGRIKDQILRGDLLVFPNYNPCLNSSRFNRSLDEIVTIIDAFLKENNIKKVAGGIEIVDPSYQTETLPRTWIWEDIGNYYGANPTGTILNENKVEITFTSTKPGSITKIVKTTPELPWMKFENRVMASTIKKDLAYAFSEPNGKIITIEGTIPANKSQFTIKASLPNPQKTLAFQLQDLIKAKGHVLTGKYRVKNISRKTITKIGKVQSNTVGEIIQSTNKHSVNILAENLLENAYRFSGSEQDKFEWAKSYLKEKFQINTTGMVLKDGSGLSRFNAISPQQVTQLLMKMKKSEVLTTSLPKSGESGTLKYFLQSTWLKGNLSAKSGSMQGVRSYAGYLTSKAGKNLAFAIIVNNYNCSSAEIKKKIEKWIEYVASSN